MEGGQSRQDQSKWRDSRPAMVRSDFGRQAMVDIIAGGWVEVKRHMEMEDRYTAYLVLDDVARLEPSQKMVAKTRQCFSTAFISSTASSLSMSRAPEVTPKV